MAAVLLNAIPILFLIFFGYLIQYKNWMLQSTVDEIKKGVTNVALPAVLFQTFINMNLKKEYIWVMVAIFVLMIIFLIIGELVNYIPTLNNPLNPFIISACTFGLLGIPLFGTVFGMENLDKISILGVGHEFFVWFVYVTYMEMKLTNKRFSVEMLKGFVKSPLILMIVLGIVFNIAGYGVLFRENPVLKGIYATIQYIGNLATPSILMIVGYGLKFNKAYMKKSSKLVILRYVIVFIIGYIFKICVIDFLIESDKLFNYAYFTFLVLPPPLSLSVFISKYGTEEQQDLINNTAVLSTVCSILLFLLFVVFFVK